MSGPIQAWLSAFFFTQAVEIPIYVAAMRREARRSAAAHPRGLPGQIALGFGASAITHPIVWFLIPRIPYHSYWVMVGRAEAFAVVAEALYFYMLYTFGLRRSLLISLLANGASVTLGLLSRSLWGWP